MPQETCALYTKNPAQERLISRRLEGVRSFIYIAYFDAELILDSVVFNSQCVPLWMAIARALLFQLRTSS